MRVPGLAAGSSGHDEGRDHGQRRDAPTANISSTPPPKEIHEARKLRDVGGALSLFAGKRRGTIFVMTT
jgi:hypothetical protein